MLAHPIREGWPIGSKGAPEAALVDGVQGSAEGSPAASNRWTVGRWFKGRESISFETYRKIEDRLSGKAKAPARKSLNADFPLRGGVVCGCCGAPLTACWSRGCRQACPYYLCPKRGCENYGKSIRRETLEGEFEVLLKSLQPTENLFRCAAAMFEEL